MNIRPNTRLRNVHTNEVFTVTHLHHSRALGDSWNLRSETGNVLMDETMVERHFELVEQPKEHKDLYFLGLARATAQRSTCSRLSVGAVLVQDDRVRGQGFNGAPRGVEHCKHTLTPENEMTGCKIAVHAEVNALLFSILEPVSLATMYVTHAPCFECAKLILQTRVSRVVYSSCYKSFDGVHLLGDHNVEVNYEGDIR